MTQFSHDVSYTSYSLDMTLKTNEEINRTFMPQKSLRKKRKDSSVRKKNICVLLMYLMSRKNYDNFTVKKQIPNIKFLKCNFHIKMPALVAWKCFTVFPWIYFCVPHSIAVIYMYANISQPCSPDQCRFIINLDILHFSILKS